MTPFQRVARWLRAAGKRPGDNPTLAVQLGVHVEEFVELMRDLTPIATDTDIHNDWTEAMHALTAAATALKTGKARVFIHSRKRVSVLDALVDGTVTTCGLAHLLGFDFDGALAEVLDSNDSKLVDGKAVLLPGGKIGKGPDYRPPRLEEFVPWTL